MIVPIAPARDRRQRRYPMEIVRLAKAMYGDGDSWTPTQIRRYLAERGHDVALVTVRCWVDPEFAEQHRRQNSASYLRRQRRAQGKARADEAPTAADVRADRTGLSDDDALKVMLRLRDLRLSHSAIAAVLVEYHGYELTVQQVRYRLLKAGAPKMEGKSRAMREQWAQQKAAEADAYRLARAA